MSDAAHYRDVVDRVMSPHKWIVCADVAAGFTQALKTWRDKGYARPLLLSGSTGSGDMPSEEDCELVILGTRSDTMMGGIRAYHAALRRLPQWALDRIEAWDPAGEAKVLSSFLDTAVEIAGRPCWGARPDAWRRHLAEKYR